MNQLIQEIEKVNQNFEEISEQMQNNPLQEELEAKSLQI